MNKDITWVIQAYAFNVPRMSKITFDQWAILLESRYDMNVPQNSKAVQILRAIPNATIEHTAIKYIVSMPV
jgi:hypothetical protein